MSIQTVQAFDFDTPGDYTRSGDCEISGGILQLEDGFLMLSNSTKKWDATMEDILSGGHEGDYRPLANTLHLALNGESTPSPLEWTDYIFTCHLLHVHGGFLTNGKTLSVYNRYYDNLGTTDYIEPRIKHSGQDDLLWDLKEKNSSVLMGTDNYLTDDFPIDAWRQVNVLMLDDDLHFQVGAQRDYWYRHHLVTQAGSVGLYLTDPFRAWYVGGDDGTPGHPSARPCPYICRRKYGACELNEASAWEMPAEIESLDWISWKTERAWLPTHEGEATPPLFSDIREIFQYDIYDGSSWGGWTALPAYGDMSGVGVGPGYKLRWRFNDGSGYGLDNGEDPRWRPQIKNVLVGHTISGEVGTDYATAQRRDAVKAGPRKGAYD